MTDLNPCSQCGAAATTQVRGEMGPGDYKEIQKVNEKGRMVFDEDYHEKVHLDDYNRHDTRVSCTECDNATGWDRPPDPAPGTSEDRAAAMRATVLEEQCKAWNAANPK